MDPAASLSGIRAFGAGEEAGLYDLIARCYREYGLTLNLDDECEQHLRDPGEYFRSHGGELWVVTDDNGIVRASAALALHGEVAELKCMYVDPSLRRRGIGRRLAEHVLRAARDRGCSTMELWSDTRFEAAHRMYESLGFTRFDRRAINDSNNSEEWGYRRSLGA